MPGARKHLLTAAIVAGPPLFWLAASVQADAPMPPGLVAAVGATAARTLAAVPVTGLGLLVVAAGALWPNVDRLVPPASRVAHTSRADEDEAQASPEAPASRRPRGWAHSLLACLVSSWFVGVLAGRALGPPGGGSESGFAALFGVGYLLHLAQDACTPSGVPFWVGMRPLLRVFWFGARLAFWPLWLVVPALNPFTRRHVVEVRLETGAPPAEPPLPPEAVRCPRCGVGHHPAASYCQVCGAALQAGGTADRPGPRITPSAALRAAALTEDKATQQRR